MREIKAWFGDLENISKEIEKHISKTCKRLEKAPEGTLRVSKTHGKSQFYIKTELYHHGKYLAKKDHSLAGRLAQKDYDNKLLKALEDQKKAIDRFLKDYDPDAAEQVYEKLSEQRKALVTPEFLSDGEFIEEWQNVTYTRLGFKDTDPEFYTAKGERVRSKSEILIADSLFRHGVPYLCEYPVYDNGVIFAAPDFKCLNVRLRKEYYWEHLGKLGDQDYVNRNANKFEKYTLSKDFDESSLILTFETETHPLNTKVIEEKIRRYLL